MLGTRLYSLTGIQRKSGVRKSLVKFLLLNIQAYNPHLFRRFSNQTDFPILRHPT
jgi:hypothetical protein